MIDAAPELHRGSLRLTARAAGDGELVLLLHGFPDTPCTWHAQLPALAAAGYRAVAPWLRGYEPASQAAGGDYTLHTLASDVVAWLDVLGAPRAHLIGHDWGASIAYAAAALAPERFHSLTTLAVPHPRRFAVNWTRMPRQVIQSRYILYFQLPALPERRLRARNGAWLTLLWRRWSPGWQPPESAMAQMRHAFAQPGVIPAALAYYRQAMQASAESARLMEAIINVPALAIGGTADRCVDPRMFRLCLNDADFSGGLQVAQIERAGHFPHMEQAEAVNDLILRHLAAHGSRTVEKRRAVPG
jgi:pimeloyl-ACP methyl ester carboxylesterase